MSSVKSRIGTLGQLHNEYMGPFFGYEAYRLLGSENHTIIQASKHTFAIDVLSGRHGDCDRQQEQKTDGRSVTHLCLRVERS